MAKIVIRGARLSFPDLFEAVQYQGQGPFTYRCSFLLPKGDKQLAAIEKAMAGVANEKWAAKGPAILKQAVAAGKTFLIDGDTKAYNGYDGHMSITAIRQETDGKPAVVDRSKSPISAGDGKIYSGCFVNGTIEIWAQDNSFGKAIRATLINVQFDKDGDSFGGAAPATTEGLDDLGYEDDDLL